MPLLSPPNLSADTSIPSYQAGYRHFDTASYYRNEATLGKALRRSGIPRDQFFLVSKVWNDAQKRAAVRQSVEQSIAELNFGGYYDLFLIHWPVPNHFVDTYRELELLQGEGKIRNIGLSNFSPSEYEELMASHENIRVTPIVNQFEVSPFMYRPLDVEYFQQKGVLVSSSKALHRGEGFDHPAIIEISKRHHVTAAQVMLRWGVQKGLIVVAKTSNFGRMVENRDILHFTLGREEMALLDVITTERDVIERNLLEKQRKIQM